jgi:hypothetical protein
MISHNEVTAILIGLVIVIILLGAIFGKLEDIEHSRRDP